MERKGQTTIFIIVAILIVVGGILIYSFFPQINSVLKGELAPNTFIRSCVEPEIERGVELLSKQGGYLNPEGYILYRGEKVKYLCYTAQYYLPCYVQQPFIKKHFEQEISALVKTKTEECVRKLRDEYENRGYSVSGISGVETNVHIAPSKIKMTINAPMTVSKETTQNFRKFEIEMPSELHDLLLIATSIVDYESTYGDSETLEYLRHYPDLSIDKTKLSDGSTVYTLSDVTGEDSFTFASRSLAWPPGYGLRT